VEVVESAAWSVPVMIDPRLYPMVARVRISVRQIDCTPLRHGVASGPSHTVFETFSVLQFVDGHETRCLQTWAISQALAVESARLAIMQTTIGYTPRVTRPTSAYRGRA
jgi:hypothetical protein